MSPKTQDDIDALAIAGADGLTRLCPHVMDSATARRMVAHVARALRVPAWHLDTAICERMKCRPSGQAQTFLTFVGPHDYAPTAPDSMDCDGFVRTRHPFTYAADELRQACETPVSRSAASAVIEALGTVLGVEPAWLATLLSEMFQDREFGRICTIPAPPARVYGGAAGQIGRPVALLPSPLRSLGRVILSAEQVEQLADLVSLAMVGVNVLQSGTSHATEEQHPAIAAFWPLVSERVEARRAAALREGLRLDFADACDDAMLRDTAPAARTVGPLRP